MDNNFFQTIKESLKGQYGGVIAAILPGGKEEGKHYVCGSLAGGPGKSCKTSLLTGSGTDYATDEKWGDIISLAAQAWKMQPLDAAYALAKQYGITVKGNSLGKANAVLAQFLPRALQPTPAAVSEPSGSFTPIMPIPENAPDLPAYPPYTAKYGYRNGQGKELFYMLRYDKKDGSKSMQPVCFCHDREDNRQWCFKMPPGQRPLYGLDRLAKADPNATVLLVEGEKAADAAQALFPDYVCMTWCGGCEAAALTDYKPIADRNIIIWPDNDAPGLTAALSLKKHIDAEKPEKEVIGGNTDLPPGLRIILPPEYLPPKWDLADEPPPDFDPVEFITHSLTPEEYAKGLFARNSKELGSAVLSYISDDEEEIILNSWPKLSRDALPGIVGEFVDLATADSEADPAAVLATMLVRFAAEVYGHARDKGPYIYVGEAIHPPRLFAVIAGNSSKARKGTSRQPVERLFERDQCDPEELAKLHLPPPAATSNGPLSTGEGLAHQVRENAETESGRDQHDKRLFIMDEELSNALSCIRREGNTLSMAIRVFWDSGEYTPLTKTDPVRVKGAHINFISHITRSELKAMLPSVHMVNGFANRILWICAKRTCLVSLPERMPRERIADLQLRIWKLVAQAQEVRQMTMTAAARETWQNVYAELSQEAPGDAGAIVNRAEAQTLRLALVYALLDGKKSIDTSHIISALALWRYAAESAALLFGASGGDPVEKKILALLRLCPSASSTIINKALGGHVSAERIQTAINNLEASNKVYVWEQRIQGKSGRPPKFVRLLEDGKK